MLETNFSEPVVARVEMKLTLNDKIIDTIEKGDLLTVTGERGDSYIIQTFNGQKGSVAKVNVARLAESVGVYDELIEANPKGRSTVHASSWRELGDCRQRKSPGRLQ